VANVTYNPAHVSAYAPVFAFHTWRRQQPSGGEFKRPPRTTWCYGRSLHDGGPCCGGTFYFDHASAWAGPGRSCCKPASPRPADRSCRLARHARRAPTSLPRAHSRRRPAQAYIHWNAEGNGFIIPDVAGFEQTCLPVYYKHKCVHILEAALAT